MIRESDREFTSNPPASGRDILLGALFMATALVLPIVFHAIGLGSEFLPMFPPIIMAAFLTSLPVALIVGSLSPLVSAVLTGMPPFFPPIAWIMVLEGVAMVAVIHFLYHRLKWGISLTLLLALLAERAVLLGAVVLVSRWLELPSGVLGLISVIRGAPGILIMMIALPALVIALKSRLDRMPMVE